MTPPSNHSENIAEALEHMHPELARVRDVAIDPVFLVGGAVRDLLLGRGRADIDLVVEGDAEELARSLGAEVVAHERFGTAKLTLDGHEVDIAAARSESYLHPGALPVVEPGAGLAADLYRRDFTINAMAIPLLGEPQLVDPYGGQVDLAARQLRVLHRGSFVDDPTRAIRAARYAARFGLTIEDETLGLLREADLGTVSSERRAAELERLANERTAPEGFALLGEWGLLELREGGVELAAAAADLLGGKPWLGFASLGETQLAAAVGPVGGELQLAEARPERPSEGVAIARGRDPVELVLARAMGAAWLDRYVAEWRNVALEIDGAELIAAGLEQGPALGRGLEAALRMKLDGELGEGREAELAAAIEAARSGDGVA